MDKEVLKTLRLCLKLRKPLKRLDLNFNLQSFALRGKINGYP